MPGRYIEDSILFPSRSAQLGDSLLVGDGDQCIRTKDYDDLRLGLCDLFQKVGTASSDMRIFWGGISSSRPAPVGVSKPALVGWELQLRKTGPKEFTDLSHKVLTQDIFIGTRGFPNEQPRRVVAATAGDVVVVTTGRMKITKRASLFN